MGAKAVRQTQGVHRAAPEPQGKQPKVGPGGHGGGRGQPNLEVCQSRQPQHGAGAGVEAAVVRHISQLDHVVSIMKIKKYLDLIRANREQTESK